MTSLRPRGALTGAALLLVLALSGTWAAQAASAESGPRVDYQPPVLTVACEQAAVAEVLRAIGEHLGFSIVAAGSAPPPLTLSVRGPVETVLRQVLVRTSYALVYRNRATVPQAADIETIIVLGPGSGEGELTTLTRKEPDRRPGITSETSASIHAAPESAHATPTVSALLKEQAMAVIPRGPAAEPNQDVASQATTVLRAQRGVQALVDALLNLNGALTKPAPGTGRDNLTRTPKKLEPGTGPEH